MKIKSYIEGVINELFEKVTWPTWSELQNSSIVVLVSSVIVALSVSIMDITFGINKGVFKGLLGYIYDFLG